MQIFEDWVELDLNPIITFSSNAKILYSNSEAQFLLNRVSARELFNIALKYAPQSYGDLTSYVDLPLQNYTFYAITVKYEDEDQIHMKLYKSAMVKNDKKINIQNIDTTNIFSLVDLAITTQSIKSNINFIKNYDPSIPEFRVDSTAFIKTINLVFDNFKNSETINCSILLKIGEYVKIDNKKYSIISVQITSDKKEDLSVLETYQQESSFILSTNESKATLDLPLII
jgi:nitrogen-specific signal transduction histidine kinase